MTTTVGISTQDTWTGPMIWPGLYHELKNVRYTNHYGNSTGGGPATFTCTAVIGPNEKVIGIKAGKILRVWRGAENVWTGIVNQPDTGGEGIGITAEGLATGMANRFLCTEAGNALLIDTQVDAAIGRGLPWKRAGTAPAWFGNMNPGATLKEALDEVAKQTGYEWAVTADGQLYWSTPRVDTTHLMWAWGQGGARTLDAFGTDFYATYNPVQDVQIDAVEAAPAAQSGASWSMTSTTKHAGESSTFTTAASVGQKTFFDYQTSILTPVDIRGYAVLAYWVSSATAVTRTVSMTLYDNNSVLWNLGNSTYALSANNVWVAHHFLLTSPPGNFDLSSVRGWRFTTDGAIYLDDIWVESEVRPNGLHVFPTQITADQSNVDARNKYGRYEVNVDLTGQGQIAANDATNAAAVARDKYSYRPRWTQPFIATQGSLTNLNGTPVDLASIVGGRRVRVMLADLADPEVGYSNLTGDAVEFVVGETDYDNENETLTLTPIDSQRKDLLTLLGKALPKGRSV